MERELRPLARALSLPRADLHGMTVWRSADVVAASVGMGPATAGAGVRRVLDATAARRVLVIGVAGAVVPWLHVGDVLVPEVVVDVAGGATYRPASTAPKTARRGTLATVHHVGAAVPDAAWAVDMETAAIAAACEERDVPWDVRRAISDVPGAVDAAVASLVRSDGRVDGRALVRFLGRHPLGAASLLRLGWDTRAAVAALTRAALEELTPVTGPATGG
jgi:adenosylhomocysteine nucleosidase